jgi:hypothetical protein
MRFCSMRDARGSRVLYERNHDGARGIGAKESDAFGQAITIYIGLGGDKRLFVDI